MKDNEEYKIKCCYCGNTISLFKSHNPDDFSENFYNMYSREDRCCERCNEKIVIPKRIMNSKIEL